MSGASDGGAAFIYSLIRLVYPVFEGAASVYHFLCRFRGQRRYTPAAAVQRCQKFLASENKSALTNKRTDSILNINYICKSFSDS